MGAGACSGGGLGGGLRGRAGALCALRGWCVRECVRLCVPCAFHLSDYEPRPLTSPAPPPPHLSRTPAPPPTHTHCLVLCLAVSLCHACPPGHPQPHVHPRHHTHTRTHTPPPHATRHTPHATRHTPHATHHTLPSPFPLSTPRPPPLRCPWPGCDSPAVTLRLASFSAHTPHAEATHTQPRPQRHNHHPPHPGP